MTERKNCLKVEPEIRYRKLKVQTSDRGKGVLYALVPYAMKQNVSTILHASACKS